MNRVTGGRNNNRKNVRRNPRLGNTVRVKTGRKKFLPKLKGNARLAVKRASVLTMMIICLFFAFSKTDNLRAYFTDLKSITNIFSINAEYTVTFNSNTGSGTMGSQSISYNVATALNTNSFTKTGYIFAGWNTESDGTGTAYTNGQEVTNIGDITLYAQWEKLPTKYAVQIYGINQDEDSSGNKLGLTFGPAVGANYNNSYVTHTYEETSAGSGEYYVKIVTHTVAADNSETTSEDYLYKNGETTDKVTRTLAEKNKYDINMHEMTWIEIAQVSDKTAFLDCMLCGDTKSVSLTLNSTLASGTTKNQYGDGAGILFNTVNNYYREWNPSPSDNSYVGTGVTLDWNEQNYGSNARNAGGYSVSHIRATLIGENSKTNKGYAGDVNLSSSNSLYSCIESDLQDVITAKKVKYVTGTSTSSYSLNEDIADKIWLFSQREMYGTGTYTGRTTEGIGISGEGYNKFGNNESKYYISSYSYNNTTSRACYNESGSSFYWWLRSPCFLYTSGVSSIYSNGYTDDDDRVSEGYGLGFGFCIDINPVNYSIKFNSNTGTGTMANQSMVSNVPTALTRNAFTKTGYTFKEWNTESDGSGTAYADGEVVSRLSSTEGEVVNLYAQWEKAPVKYAVQIYGINQDEDSAGNTLGLTFGPATGANYNNSYVTHTYEETSSGSGEYYVKIVTHTVAADNSETTSEEYLTNSEGINVTRTETEMNKYNVNMHNMTWTQIANETDKTKFLDCMLCGDTKSVQLILNSDVASGHTYTQYGDGASLYNTIKYELGKWNPKLDDNIPGRYGSNARSAGGYSSSHIRATLIGSNSKTRTEYAGNDNLTENNCLYSCIETSLRNVIAAKKVKYVTGTSTTNYRLNEDIFDKIWLFSNKELMGNSYQSGGNLEGLGPDGTGYSKFSNTDSKYFISTSLNGDNGSTDSRVLWYENGGRNSWFTRSVRLNETYYISHVNGTGAVNYNLGLYSYPSTQNCLAFGFCIDSSPVNYSVKFNANTGSGTMANQSMVSNEPTALTTNAFTKTGYTFKEWNTESDGSGTAYADGQVVSKLSSTEGEVVNLYAQWEKLPTKYAVQIYGINQDEDSSGNTLGLTFGPAVGANYNNSYVTHTYEETSTGSGEYYVKIVTHTVASDGTETTSEDYLYKNGGTTEKVTRTTAEKNKYDINMHEMTWNQIKAVSDKTAFLDCMLCGDTKSVKLALNSTIATSNVYNQYGDGAGLLYNTINIYYRNWNPNPSVNSYVGTGVTLDSNEQSHGSNARNAGGYSISHIRATLIGENSKTNKGYAGDVNLDSSNSLYSCIDSSLQNVITAKKVKYVTGTSTSSYSLNDDISDKIWLFSQREMYGTGQYTGGTTEGIGTSGDGYNKFGNSESKYYISSYNNSNNTNKVSYNEAGTADSWWVRSPYLNLTYTANAVGNYGGIGGSSYVDGRCGLGFGFCIE